MLQFLLSLHLYRSKAVCCKSYCTLGCQTHLATFLFYQVQSLNIQACSRVNQSKAPQFASCLPTLIKRHSAKHTEGHSPHTLTRTPVSLNPCRMSRHQSSSLKPLSQSWSNFTAPTAKCSKYDCHSAGKSSGSRTVSVLSLFGYSNHESL